MGGIICRVLGVPKTFIVSQIRKEHINNKAGPLTSCNLLLLCFRRGPRTFAKRLLASASNKLMKAPGSLMQQKTVNESTRLTVQQIAAKHADECSRGPQQEWRPREKGAKRRGNRRASPHHTHSSQHSTRSLKSLSLQPSDQRISSNKEHVFALLAVRVAAPVRNLPL